MTDTGFPCRTCGGPVYVEMCSDWNDTDHPWMTAMECRTCGARLETTCARCEYARAER